jgi:hypothetical protein
MDYDGFRRFHYTEQQEIFHYKSNCNVSIMIKKSFIVNEFQERIYNAQCIHSAYRSW